MGWALPYKMENSVNSKCNKNILAHFTSNIAGNSMTVAGGQWNGVGFIENYCGTFLYKIYGRKLSVWNFNNTNKLRVISKAKKGRYR